MPPKTHFFKSGEVVNGFLFIKEDGKTPGGGRAAIFKCPFCSQEFRCYLPDVASGRRESCGCQRKLMNIRHGATRFGVSSPEFKAWMSMKGRCYNPKLKAYKHYGARGISVCDRWINSFENFIADMGLRPSPSHSLERKEVNGNYEPDNCKWATPKEQANNQRNNVKVEYKGRIQTIKAWCEELGLHYGRTRTRISSSKWSPEKAFTYPVMNKGYRAIKNIKRRQSSKLINHTFGFIR